MLRGSQKLAVVAASVLAALSGAATVAFLSLLNRALSSSVSLPILFTMVGAVVVTQAVASGLVSHVATVHLIRLRTELVAVVSRSPFDTLEALGEARIITGFAQDGPAISAALQAVINVASSVVVTVGALGYLAVLSPSLFAMCLVLVAFGIGSSQLLGNFLMARQRERSRRIEELHDLFPRLVRGGKELRLNGRRQNAFVSGRIGGQFAALSGIDQRSAVGEAVSMTWLRMVLFASMGLFATLGRTRLDATSAQASAFVLTSFYLLSSLASVMSARQTFAQARIGHERLKALQAELTATPPEPPWVGAQAPLADWKSIELLEVTYRRSDGSAFVLGPVSLEIKRGTIVFIVGGNGSGKSTLGRVLTGLSKPRSGEIAIGEVPVGDANRTWYRQHFSAVFADFHLFEEVLLGVPDPESVAKYLRLLELDSVVTFDGKRFSSTSLSTGQRKRLALLAAYVEDRPVLLFDEWAADQDPGFKTVFYRTLLPELKARGKTVVCISHDERYFHLADQVLKLDGGRLTNEGTAAFVARLSRT